MQLVAYGAQDIYLTGYPLITFYKVVYWRNTTFSKETITQQLKKINSAIINKVNSDSNLKDIYKAFISGPNGKSIELKRISSNITTPSTFSADEQFGVSFTSIGSRDQVKFIDINNNYYQLKDKLTLNFTEENWHIPQYVDLIGTDDFLKTFHILCAINIKLYSLYLT